MKTANFLDDNNEPNGFAVADAAIAHFHELCVYWARRGAHENTRRWLREAIAEQVNELRLQLAEARQPAAPLIGEENA